LHIYANGRAVQTGRGSPGVHQTADNDEESDCTEKKKNKNTLTDVIRLTSVFKNMGRDVILSLAATEAEHTLDLSGDRFCCEDT